MLICCAYWLYSQCSMHYINDLSNSMEFANAEIEDIKKNDKENEVKIKEFEDKIFYPEVYNRRENLRFFGFPESADGAENTHEVVRKFLSDELEMENAADIEFQRAHRIGKKKTGETRPVIVRFLRFPERELVFRRVRSWRMISILRSTRIFLKK